MHSLCPLQASLLSGLLLACMRRLHGVTPLASRACCATGTTHEASGHWQLVQAAGSSLLARICHFLVLDALHAAGLAQLAALQVFPLATGMALTCAFLACAALRPEPLAARRASPDVCSGPRKEHLQLWCRH